MVRFAVVVVVVGLAAAMGVLLLGSSGRTTTQLVPVGVNSAAAKPSDDILAFAGDPNRANVATSEQRPLFEELKRGVRKTAVSRVSKAMMLDEGTVTVEDVLCQKWLLLNDGGVKDSHNPDSMAADATNARCAEFEQRFRLSIDSCENNATRGLSFVRAASPVKLLENVRRHLDHIYLFGAYDEHIASELRREHGAFTQYPLVTKSGGEGREIRLRSLQAGVSVESAHRSEGTCVPPSYYNFSQGPPQQQVNATAFSMWTDEELIMAFLIDLEGALGALLPSEVKEKFPDGVLCTRPKLRAILRLSANTNWMFRVFRPPLLLQHVEDAVELQMLDNSPNRSPVRFNASVLKMQVDFSYSGKQLRMLKKSMSRNNPIYYNIRNAYVPSSESGGRLYGSSVEFLDQLRDERWIRVKEFQIDSWKDNVAVPSRFVVKDSKLLVILPVIFASNNIGHVMFRHMSIIQLFQRLKLPQEDAIMAYQVLRGAGVGFGPHNLHKAFYQAVHGPWVSIFGSEPAKRQSPVDIVFSRVITGFGGIAQFHHTRTPAMVNSMKFSVKLLTSVWKKLRSRTASCYQLPNRYLPTPKLPVTSTSEPFHIVIIRRQKRKLLNADELLQSYAKRALVFGFTENVSSSREVDSYLSTRDVSSDSRLVDPTTRLPVTISTVDFEFMSLRQQAKLLGDTDVLIGPMGAGMSWMMFMRPHSAVVELQLYPSMKCTGHGINTDRLVCDYSKLSVAANLNHIGFRLNEQYPCHPMLCDGTLSQESFNRLIAAALCTLKKTQNEAIALCSALVPPRRNETAPTSNETVPRETEESN